MTETYGNGPLTWDELESIRGKATANATNAEALASVTERVGGDPQVASRMLRGPTASPHHIKNLMDYKDNQEVIAKFDEWYGQGAAENFISKQKPNVLQAALMTPQTLNPGDMVMGAVAGGVKAVTNAVGAVMPEWQPQIDKFNKAITDSEGAAPPSVAHTVGEIGGQFVAPGAAVFKGLKGATALSSGAALAWSEGIVGYLAQSPNDANIIKSVMDRPESPAGRAFYDALATNKDDPQYLNRFRNAVEALVGLGVAEGAAKALFRHTAEAADPLMTQGAKEYRKARQEAAGATEAPKATVVADEALNPSGDAPSVFKEPPAPHGNYLDGERSSRPRQITDDMVVDAEGVVLKTSDTVELLGEYAVEDVVLLATRGTSDVTKTGRVLSLIDDVIELAPFSNYAKGTHTAEEARAAARSTIPEIEKFIQEEDFKGLLQWALGPTNHMDEALIRQDGILAAEAALRMKIDQLYDIYSRLPPGARMEALEGALDRLTAAWKNVKNIDTQMGTHFGQGLQSRKNNFHGIDLDANTRQVAVAEAPPKKVRTPKEEARYTEEKILAARQVDDAYTFKAGMIADFVEKGGSHREGKLLAEYYMAELEGAGAKLSDIKHNIAVELKADPTQSLGGKIMGTIMEQRYGALLSNWKTHETNIIGTVGNILTKFGSQGLFGSPEVRRAALDKLVGMYDALSVAAKLSGKAFMEERALLSPIHNMDHSKKMWSTQAWLGRDAEGVLGHTFNFVGKNVVRVPGRGMLMTDEFLKQLVARGEVHAAAAREGRLLGLSGTDLEKHIQDAIARKFTSEGKGLDALAVARAESLTFQRNFATDSKYRTERLIAEGGEFINRVPAVRLLVPFYNTTMRLMQEGYHTLPGLNMVSKHYRDDLFGRNGLVKQAEARGQLVLGTALSATAWHMALNGDLTGAGPADYKAQKLAKGSFPGKFMMRVGDEWHDVGQYEPLATVLKVVASGAERVRQFQMLNANGEFDGNLQKQLEEVADAAAYSFAMVPASNPFNTAIADLISLVQKAKADDTTKILPELLNQQVSASVPSLLKHINTAMRDGLTPDTVGFLNKIVKDLPVVGPHSDRGFDRNVLGELNRKDIAPLFTNMEGHPDKYDPVISTLVDSNLLTSATFAKPSPRSLITKSEVDTRSIEVKGHDGQPTSLYDKYLDTVSKYQDPQTGFTLREALTHYITTGEFQEGTYGVKAVDRSRTMMLGKIISSYRSAAKLWMRENEPEWQRIEAEVNSKKGL
jgi:hypothetical protein